MVGKSYHTIQPAPRPNTVGLENVAKANVTREPRTIATLPIRNQEAVPKA
jgi:hypothetical protein